MQDWPAHHEPTVEELEQAALRGIRRRPEKRTPLYIARHLEKCPRCRTEYERLAKELTS